VDLISGHGEDYWPRPGRIFAAARSHKFSQLADAIDTAFARWDRSHLYKFELAVGVTGSSPVSSTSRNPLWPCERADLVVCGERLVSVECPNYVLSTNT
jgi:hypothetical protein